MDKVEGVGFHRGGGIAVRNFSAISAISAIFPQFPQFPQFSAIFFGGGSSDRNSPPRFLMRYHSLNLVSCLDVSAATSMGLSAGLLAPTFQPCLICILLSSRLFFTKFPIQAVLILFILKKCLDLLISQITRDQTFSQCEPA